MKTVRFARGRSLLLDLPHFYAYRADPPNALDGHYVPAAIARTLLEACEKAVRVMDSLPTGAVISAGLDQVHSDMLAALAAAREGEQ